MGESEEGDESRSLESTRALLDLAKAGDDGARDRLFSRYQPRLRQWAHGRLPRYARTLADTDDLVQKTLLKTIRNFEHFALEHEEGFNHYLRLTIQNAVRDEIRRARRKPPHDELDPRHPSGTRSPLEQTIDGLRLERYERALGRLPVGDREAIVARFEFGFTHGELAAALGKSTPDAARKVCEKAVAALLELMQVDDRES